MVIRIRLSSLFTPVKALRAWCARAVRQLHVFQNPNGREAPKRHPRIGCPGFADPLRSRVDWEPDAAGVVWPYVSALWTPIRKRALGHATPQTAWQCRASDTRGPTSSEGTNTAPTRAVVSRDKAMRAPHAGSLLMAGGQSVESKPVSGRGFPQSKGERSIAPGARRTPERPSPPTVQHFGPNCWGCAYAVHVLCANALLGLARLCSLTFAAEDTPKAMGSGGQGCCQPMADQMVLC